MTKFSSLPFKVFLYICVTFSYIADNTESPMIPEVKEPTSATNEEPKSPEPKSPPESAAVAEPAEPEKQKPSEEAEPEPPAEPTPAPKPEATKRPLIPKAGLPMMGGAALMAEMKKRQNKDKPEPPPAKPKPPLAAAKPDIGSRTGSVSVGNRTGSVSAGNRTFSQSGPKPPPPKRPVSLRKRKLFMDCY